jgi:hypothetical protein
MKQKETEIRGEITALPKTVLSSLPFEGLPNACINES